MEKMTAEEFRKRFAGKAKRNKYNARRTEYEGVWYDSRKEAFHAAKLDLMVRAGEVESWEGQHPIPLESNGQDVGKYYIDFRVTMADGSIEYHEVKGKETPLWKLKWKMAHAYMEKYEPDSKLVLIK